jgi:cobalamin biosynthesis Mg chelatase CobN
VYRDPLGENKCPDGDITITACVAGMSATNLTTAGVNINQNCGSENTKTTETHINKSGGGIQSDSATTQSSGSTVKTGEPTDKSSSDKTSSDQASSSSVVFWVIIGISVVILIGLIIFFMKN